MGQVVKIECSNCEAIETYEMDGCVLIGLQNGELLVKKHEVDDKNLIAVLLEAVDMLKEVGGWQAS